MRYLNKPKKVIKNVQLYRKGCTEQKAEMYISVSNKSFLQKTKSMKTKTFYLYKIFTKFTQIKHKKETNITQQKQPLEVFCKKRCSLRKGALRNFAKFTGKHLCQSLFFKKEAVAQVFSCEFCEISKNTFFT